MNRSALRLLRLLVLGGLAITWSFGLSIAQAEGPVPFKATIEITEVVQPNTTLPNCPPFNPAVNSFGLRGDITGNGTLTLVGKITATSVDCIIPTSLDGSSFVAFSTQAVLTGPDGSQLFATYNAQLILTSLKGVALLRGNFVILGGTGIFSHAAGGGTLEGVEIIQFTSPFSGTGKGRIVLSGVVTY